MDATATGNGKRQFYSLWLTLLLIWLVANSSLAPEIIVTGAFISALLAMLFASVSRVYADIRWTPRVLFYAAAFLAVFLLELVKANLNVARLVFAPHIRIKPGIVEIKTRLRTPIGRMVLANAITLTPGTLVVDIKGDALFIHWIVVSAQDPVAATREIAGRFEKYLEIVFG